MAELRLVGGTTADGTPLDLSIVGGRVAPGPEAGTAAEPAYDARGLTLLPGLIDLQVNGVAGIDFTRQPERIWEGASALAAFGVTAFLPTVITSEPGVVARALAVLRDGAPAEWRGAVPLGLHVEGPMLAPERKGAHPEQWLRSPSLDLVDSWSRAAGTVMVTLAPELPGALEVIEALVARDVIVSMGHTAATAAEVRAGVDRGARALTHLGNAMPPLQAREPGPVGVALGDDRVVAGVIADGHHLDPLTLAAYARALGPTRLLAVTDCTAALGLPDGATRLGDRHVTVSAGTVRLEDGTLAGSSASLSQCLRELRAATGWELSEAVATCTSTPADLLGDASRGRLTAGARGDVTLLDPDGEVVATVVAGELVHGRLEGAGLMEVVPLSTPEEVASVAADLVEAVVRARPRAVLGLATGSSPLPTYDELIRRHQAGQGPAYGRVRCFTLDEYVGLPAGHPQTYRATIARVLTDALGIPPDQVSGPDPTPEGLPGAGERYEAALAAAGGIDVQLLGIGSDGHVAFNEPGSSLGSRTRLKTLTEETRRDNARYFGSPDEVPRHVLTQGLGTIVRSRHAVLIATGAAKADAVAAAVEGSLTASCPASALQLHPRATVLVDEAAGALLQRTAYYREVYAGKPDWQRP